MMTRTITLDADDLAVLRIVADRIPGVLLSMQSHSMQARIRRLHSFGLVRISGDVVTIDAQGLVEIDRLPSGVEVSHAK